MAVDLAISDKDKKELIQFASKCIRVRKVLRIGSTSLTPANYEDEKKKFLESHTYNPIYFYRTLDLRKIDDVITHLESKVTELNLPKDIEDHLYTYLENLHLLRLTKSTIGTNEFTETSKRLLDWDALEKVETPSLKSIAIKNKEPGTLYSAKDIRTEFLKVIEKRYKIKDFDVLIDTYTNNIISAGYEKVTIGSKVKRHKNNVKRLIVHEIESHVLQTHNMKQSHSYADLSMYSDSLIYSEGLALYNEIASKTATSNALETYFYRLETAKMLQQSFRSIYDYLCNHMKPHRAFVATYRVKRGIRETGLPGGFVKDAVYLIGYQKVKDYVKENKTQAGLYKTKSPTLTKLLEKYGLLNEDALILPAFIKGGK